MSTNASGNGGGYYVIYGGSNSNGPFTTYDGALTEARQLVTGEGYDPVLIVAVVARVTLVHATTKVDFIGPPALGANRT